LNEEIRQLTELQTIDLEVAKLDAALAIKQAELDARKAAVAKRQALIVELAEKITTTEARQRELEAAHADELARIKDRQSKMMKVQTNREYQSLLKEIEDGKKVNKEREEELVRLIEELEAVAKNNEEQKNLCKGEEELLAEELTKVESLASELHDQKAAIAKKRNAKAKEIGTALLRKYDMLRERRNGKAVAGVVKSVCQGCFMRIPPQQYNEILKGDGLFFCPTCQRILYNQAENNAA